MQMFQNQLSAANNLIPNFTQLAAQSLNSNSSSTTTVTSVKPVKTTKPTKQKTKCTECDGTGNCYWVPSYNTQRDHYCNGTGVCGVCSGKGYVSNPYLGINSTMKCTYCDGKKTCPRCGGSKKCRKCGGAGYM